MPSRAKSKSKSNKRARSRSRSRSRTPTNLSGKVDLTNRGHLRVIANKLAMKLKTKLLDLQSPMSGIPKVKRIKDVIDDVEKALRDYASDF